MHILAGRNRSEFLAVPQLVRFDMAVGGDGMAPSLLIKCSTLVLKYFLRLKRFRIIVFPIDDHCIGYGVQIFDDPLSPATFWSVAEHQNEIDALFALSKNSQCPVFLFNEAAVNVAWAMSDIPITDGRLIAKLGECVVCMDSSNHASKVGELLDRFSRDEAAPDSVFVLGDQEVTEWHELKNTYITNRISQSELSIFSGDEGAQQEELALWLIDGLSIEGAVKSPQISEPGGNRELADLLLSYHFGCFLIESKGLSILERGLLPARERLKSSVVTKFKKAVSQLKGGCKNLKRGYKIVDQKGQVIEVPPAQPAHAIVLVPELSLLDDVPEVRGEALKNFAKEAGGYLHILDPSELLRMVQSANTISGLGKTTTPMMAFDYYLLERFKKAIELDRANFQMLLRITDGEGAVGEES